MLTLSDVWKIESLPIAERAKLIYELGDSKRCQLEASRKYAKENKYTLDETLTDRGLSAYHGVHRDRGHLGKFLRLFEWIRIYPLTEKYVPDR